mgnify:CR=1 FL=1
MSSTLKVWAPISLVYLSFFLWYTNLSGPISEEEIESYIGSLDEGEIDERTKFIRKFLKEDDGNDFYMVNLLDNNESPRTMPATGEGATAADLQAHYMGYMFPEMLKRATHPGTGASSKLLRFQEKCWMRSLQFSRQFAGSILLS